MNWKFVIPNLGEEELTGYSKRFEEATKDLDAKRYHPYRCPGKRRDILIGKITPKERLSDPTPKKSCFVRSSVIKPVMPKTHHWKPPNSEGVIDKKLFQRAKKIRMPKVREKQLRLKKEKIMRRTDDLKKSDLKTEHTWKLDFCGCQNNFGKVQIGKGKNDLPNKTSGLWPCQYQPALGWTSEESGWQHQPRCCINYNIKYSEELGRYKGRKFNISIGDELPAGVWNWLKFISLWSGNWSGW